MAGYLSEVCALVLILGTMSYSDALSILNPDHPGACPRPAFCDNLDFCKTAKFAVCSGDNECKPNEKCCHNGCAPVCTTADRVKPGGCPKPMWYNKKRVCALNVKPECLHDYQCPSNMKCCKDHCGPKCMKPLGVKPGICPKLGWFTELKPLHKGRQCYNDCDCPRHQKCCRRGCDYICVGAVKPGQCRPYKFELHQELDQQLDRQMQCHKQRRCFNDFHCPKDWKCCKTRCGQVCTPPFAPLMRG
ncbi:unnamed protein product [Ophioblennius macclurei]